TGPQSIHSLRGVRQQQDELGRFSICSRQAAGVQSIFFRILPDSPCVIYNFFKTIIGSILYFTLP
ncbi:hypothetical protein MTQ60_24690, partial [Escherichia coli]|nr:hypothetical protein [Escherichia coli]